jgi:hypothetical protein
MPGGETIGDIDSVFFALLTLSVMVLSAALHALQIEGYGPGAVERVGLGALTVLPSENPRRAAFSVLCFSISAASSSSLIRPRRALGPAELLLLVEALDQPPTPFLPDEFLRSLMRNLLYGRAAGARHPYRALWRTDTHGELTSENTSSRHFGE